MTKKNPKHHQGSPARQKWLKSFPYIRTDGQRSWNKKRGAAAAGKPLVKINEPIRKEGDGSILYLIPTESNDLYSGDIPRLEGRYGIYIFIYSLDIKRKSQRLSIPPRSFIASDNKPANA